MLSCLFLGSDVTRVGTDLKFSKKLDYDVEVEISYYIG